MENHDRHRALGGASLAKGLDDAPPSGPICVPELRTVVSLKASHVGCASNPDIASGEIPIPSTQVIVTTWTVWEPGSSVDFSSDFSNEESKQDEDVPSSAGASTGTPEVSHMTAGSSLYTLEEQRVPDDWDGNEAGSMMEGESQIVGTQWYRRPLYRWMVVGCILLVCGIVGAVVAIVVPRNQSAQSVSDSTPPELIACQFLSIRDVTVCQSTASFDSFNTDDRTTGSTIPSEIGLLTQLTYLDFYGNQLTSTIPTEIGLLIRLTALSFYNNSLTSKTPSEIGRMTKLMGLSFSRNELTSTIPTEMGLMTRLKYLDFSSNYFISTIPSEITFLTQLTYLDFYNNSLTSKIPSEIGRLTQLTGLDLSSNELISTLPSEIGLLTLLLGLSFADNALTSTIPSEIGLLTQLSFLSFWINALTSTIPIEIGGLSKLTYLDFSDNQLTSTIPSES